MEHRVFTWCFFILTIFGVAGMFTNGYESLFIRNGDCINFENQCHLKSVENKIQGLALLKLVIFA